MSLGDHNDCNFIGRLTRDPERREFNGGGSVATFSIAFTGTSKKGNDGKWIDDPCFLECSAFNPQSGNGRKLCDVVMNYTKKGSRVFIKGRLILEKWDDRQTGQKRQAHKLRVSEIILLDKKEDGGSGSGGSNYSGGNDSQNQQSDDDGDIPF